SCDHHPLHSFPTRRSSDLASKPVSATVVLALPVPDNVKHLLDYVKGSFLLRHLEGPEELGARLAAGHDEGEVAAAEDEARADLRSEEHTSELQSRGHLVCR